MSVSNGQIANATTFNNAFVSKAVDDTKAGKLNMTDTTEAGADAGALRLQGGLYIAKKTYQAGIAQLLKGLAVGYTNNSGATGSAQEIALLTPLTVLTNTNLISVQALSVSGSQTLADVAFIKNATGKPLKILHNTGTAGNRINTGCGTTVLVRTGHMVILVYDPINTIWQLMGDYQQHAEFDIVNNQSAAADVTGLIFDNTLVRSVEIKYCVTRITTSTGAMARVQRGTLILTWDGTDWLIYDGPASSVDAGVTFDVDAATGQVTYQSDDQTGTPSISKLTYNISDVTEGI